MEARRNAIRIFNASSLSFLEPLGFEILVPIVKRLTLKYARLSEEIRKDEETSKDEEAQRRFEQTKQKRYALSEVIKSIQYAIKQVYSNKIIIADVADDLDKKIAFVNQLTVLINTCEQLYGKTLSAPRDNVRATTKEGLKWAGACLGVAASAAIAPLSLFTLPVVAVGAGAGYQALPYATNLSDTRPESIRLVEELQSALAQSSQQLNEKKKENSVAPGLS